MTLLTPHFGLEELTVSETAARLGLDNTPDAAVRANLLLVAERLEQIRELVGVPIHVSSGYRAAAVNAAIGGSPTSAHMRGLAADFIAPAFGSPIKVAQAIRDSDLDFDQLIYEYGTWVHIGLSLTAARLQCLSKFAGTGYISGLVEKPSGSRDT